MKTKTFTFLQLFILLDEQQRVTTTVGEIYDILNHIFDESFNTHHLPVAIKFLKEVAKPEWLMIMTADFNSIKVIGDTDNFEYLVEQIKKHYNVSFPIPQLTAAQKTGFEQYMIDNSMLQHLGKNIKFSNKLPGTVRNILLVILLGAVMFFMSSCEGNPDYSQRTVRIVGSRELHSARVHKCQLKGDTITVMLENKSHWDDFMVVVEDDCN